MFSNLVTVGVITVLASGSLRLGVPVSAPERHSPPTRNELLWDTAEVLPSQVFRVDKAIALYRANKSRYEKISDMRDGKMPPAVIFVLHGRESTWSFKRHLHEGSPLTGRTRYVPKGRPKHGNPPFTFEDSAEDALYILKDMENVNWASVDAALHAIEKFNGLGYYYRGVVSPYVHAGNNHYKGGKFYADHKYSSKVWDKQLGCATILKRMSEVGIDIGFR